jgi:nucleotide-binding universal stress UspA family protein
MTFMISKIIIQTDGSKSSQEAALFAVDLAKQLKASVIVLSLISHRSIRRALPRGTPIHLIGPIEKHLWETAQRRAGEIRKWCDENGVRSKTIIAIGNSAEETMHEAKEANMDVIVMGSYESSSFAAALRVGLGKLNRCLCR